MKMLQQQKKKMRWLTNAPVDNDALEHRVVHNIGIDKGTRGHELLRGLADIRSNHILVAIHRAND